MRLTVILREAYPVGCVKYLAFPEVGDLRVDWVAPGWYGVKYAATPMEPIGADALQARRWVVNAVPERRARKTHRRELATAAGEKLLDVLLNQGVTIGMGVLSSQLERLDGVTLD
jgi:hypothetical protein